MKLSFHRYGKARVRVLRVHRTTATHRVKELEVTVLLRGKFESSYTNSDNTLVVATDTMKNKINILAKEKLGSETEEFGREIGEHFLKTYPQVNDVEVSLSEHCWERLESNGSPHSHAFMEKSGAKPFAIVTCSRETGPKVDSGIENLLIMKSTGSGFEGFFKDQYTTLPETKDRILATRLRAVWSYQTSPASHAATNAQILSAMLDEFAVRFSPSVQATLFEMGKAALRAAPEISKVTLTMPNQHCLLVNLAPFGIENENELFVPTDEPHGVIEGTVSRE